MTLPEYFAELEFNTTCDADGQYAGTLTDEDVRELRDYMNGASGTQG